MPPKKSSVSKADNPHDEVLEYLKRANRPFSATDIVTNLHGAVAKTQVQKVLDALVKEETVVSKSYGKSQVYVINQNELEIPSPDDLAALDKRIQEMTDQIAKLGEQNAKLESRRKQLVAVPTNHSAEKELEELEKENEALLERLTGLREGKVQFSAKDKKKIDKQYDEYRGLWKKRKMMTMEIVDALVDAMETVKKKDFIEDVGIETDEMVGADIKVNPLAGL